MLLSDYTYQQQQPTWCPGCGNFAILQAIKKALLNQKTAPKDTVVTYDIGCGGNMINNLRVCGFASLHGRSIPVAVGAKYGNPDLTVLAQCGDGGLLNEGVNHLVHAAQRDDDITVLLHNNLVFALTTGQASAASPAGIKTKSTPTGNPYEPLNALALAATAGAGFLARSFAFEIDKTTQLIEQAIAHPGFSLVEIMMPCLIWSKGYQETYKNRFSWLNKSLSQEELREVLYQKQEKIPLGLIWQEN